MLKAIDQNGMVVTLSEMNRIEIMKHRRKNNFFCPRCKEKVNIKAGSKVIAHFAHQSESHCPFKEGGEGAYHERGKLHLYRWLKRQSIHVQLEAYLPEIKQRPDLLIKIGEKLVALEFQCARISEQDFLSRNSGYLRLGITPLWILGGNRMKRKGKNMLCLNSNDLHFLHQFSDSFPLTLYYYCPDAENFSVFQHVQATGKKKTFGILHFGRLRDMLFTDLFKQEENHLSVLYQYWREEKRKFRMKPNAHMTTQERKWRQWLYGKGIYHTLLPSIVHLPVASQYLMKSPPWIWQSRILIDLLQSYEQITPDMCHALLKNEQKQTLFPLITKESSPYIDYLNLLVQFRYVKKQTPFSYQLVKKIYFPQTIKEAIEEDDRLMQSFFSTSIPTHDSITDTIY